MKRISVLQFPIEILTLFSDQSMPENYEAIVTNYELFGSNDEFHNASSELARLNQYELACIVLDSGLSQYPNDTDLLADYLSYGVKCGESEKAKACYDRLEEIPKALYTWRSFTFMVKYLLFCYTSNMFDTSVDVKSACNKIISDYKKYLPLEEKAYMCEFEVEEAFGATSEFLLQILKSAIAKIKVSPQCCMKFVDKSLELGNYDDVIIYARRGLSAAAQEQESVDTGYFYYAAALAMDAKWYDDQDDMYGDVEYAKEIIKKYRASDVALDENKATYRKLLKKRANMIATEIGVELPYPPCISQSNKSTISFE